MLLGLDFFRVFFSDFFDAFFGCFGVIFFVEFILNEFLRGEFAIIAKIHRGNKTEKKTLKQGAVIMADFKTKIPAKMARNWKVFNKKANSARNGAKSIM